MTFSIDTGAFERPYGSMSGPTDGKINYAGRGEHAERKHRQIVAEISSCETLEEVDAILAAESEAIDSLYLNFPVYCEAITAAADDWKAMLPKPATSGAPVTAQSLQSQTKEKPMFAIDTGETGGSKGPWLSWTSNGSAMKGFQPMKWVLRSKDDNDQKIEEMIPAFENGCVMDIDSLKLGWEKDGAKGMAPERRWNPSIAQSTPRPDESKKPSGAYAWSRALQVRLAIGGGKSATWEQGSFAAYAAFEKLAKEIQAQYPGDGTLPLVKQTGVEQRSLPSGSANIPVLTIERWVPRPDCLKDDAPQIDTGAEQAVTQQAQPAQAAPAQQAAMADDTF